MGKPKEIQIKSLFDKMGLNCGRNLKILLIAVSHMAYCNLRNLRVSRPIL